MSAARDSLARPKRRSAFLTMEILVSIGLAVTLAILSSVAITQYAAVRRANDTRRMLRLLAAGELDRIRTGVCPAADGEQVLSAPGWPEAKITTTISAGEGAWQGLTRVRVAAAKDISPSRRIEVTLTAYVAVGGAGPSHFHAARPRPKGGSGVSPDSPRIRARTAGGTPAPPLLQRGPLENAIALVGGDSP